MTTRVSTLRDVEESWVTCLAAPLTCSSGILVVRGRERSTRECRSHERAVLDQGPMKESLAARQAALLRRNAELDEQVEAIEQRRQQQQQQQSQGSRPPSSSTAERRNRKKSAETSAVGSGSRHERMEDGGKEADSGGEDEHDDAAPVVPSALARSSSSRSHINLPMDLSASIDSFGAAARGGGEALNGQPDATKKQERLTKSRSGEAVTEDDDTSGLNSVGDRNKRSVSKVKTDDEDGGEGEGLGLEATVRYQKARLRVLQDEVDAASAQIKELVRGASGPAPCKCARPY